MTSLVTQIPLCAVVNIEVSSPNTSGNAGMLSIEIIFSLLLLKYGNTNYELCKFIPHKLLGKLVGFIKRKEFWGLVAI